MDKVINNLDLIISDMSDKFMSYVKDDSININLKDIENRSKILNELTLFKRKLDDFADKMTKKIKELKKMHDEEIIKVNNFLASLHYPNSENGTDVSISNVVISSNSVADVDEWKKVTNKRAAYIHKERMSEMENKTNTHDIQSINIENNLFLDAIKVKSFSDVKSDGNLYYIEDSNHFAIKIAGYMLHGNIGVIYTNGRDPEKIKNCKFGNGCIKPNCNYYHNPLLYEGSRDVRNFIANSWLYAPPNSPFRYKKKSRRYGCKGMLDIDLSNLSSEEAERFIDQCVHDLLCSLLIFKYFYQND